MPHADRQPVVESMISRLLAARSRLAELSHRPDYPESWRLTTAVQVLDAVLATLRDPEETFEQRLKSVHDGLRGIFNGFADASEEFCTHEDHPVTRETRALFDEVEQRLAAPRPTAQLPRATQVDRS